MSRKIETALNGERRPNGRRRTEDFGPCLLRSNARSAAGY